MAIIGTLSIVASDGTELTSSSDVRLAELWAAHENGALWPQLSQTERWAETADALDALRQAYGRSL